MQPIEIADNAWEREGMVSLWLGDFSSQEEFDRYFAEYIDPDDDDSPINRFAADTNIRYYDIGFQEAIRNGDAPLPVDQFLRRFSYSSSFIDAGITAAAERAGIAEANAAVMLFNCDYNRQHAADSPLRFIGSFPYDQNAPAVEPQ